MAEISFKIFTEVTRFIEMTLSRNQIRVLILML